MHGDPGRKESWYWTHSGPLIVSAWTTLTSLLQHVLMLSLNFLSEQQLVLLHCWYRALVLFQNCNDVLQFSIIKINCCLSCSYHIDYVFINEGFFYRTHPGSSHITTLHGSLILLEGLTPPDDPPLFRTLHPNLLFIFNSMPIFAYASVCLA